MLTSCCCYGVVILLLEQVRNGEKRWYQLKDKKGQLRVKGAIQLELDLIVNHVRVLCSTFSLIASLMISALLEINSIIMGVGRCYLDYITLAICHQCFNICFL